MLLPLLTHLPFDVSDKNAIFSWINIFGGNYDTILEEFNYVFYGTPFEDIFIWFQDNISTSSFLVITFGTLVYELYLSLMFLIFDFINMIFSWANKFMNKGGNLDD